MPSPFPGMDPFIEGDIWQDFHLSIIISIRDLLVPSVRPRYVVRTEERIYLEHEMEGGQSRYIQPDLVITDMRPRSLPSQRVLSGATAVIEPMTITLPMPEEIRERYLTIRKRETGEIVTVLEVLSPANKKSGSYDRALYLAKRDEVLMSGINLVELDLLRGGLRLPAVEPLPESDFQAIICLAADRPRATAFTWTLRQQLPTIQIPLAEGDSDIALDLQAAFTAAYDHAGYDYSLDYQSEIRPQLSDPDMKWAAQVVTAGNLAE